MIASNPRRTDSAAVYSISYVAAHVLPLNYVFCFFFYNGKHIVSCICLHLIMSSQCVHWHACCVMLSVSPRVFACMSWHVLPRALAVVPLFRTGDDHSADHHLSPCSLVDLVIKRGGGGGKSASSDDINSLSISLTSIRTIHHPNSYGLAFIFGSYLYSPRQ